MRGRDVWVLVGALVATPRVAWGQVPALELVWSAPPGCPTQSEIARHVDAILDGRVPAAPLTVHALAERAPDERWRVLLSIDEAGTKGQRTFEAESCEAAADATAVIVELLVDPTGKLSPPPPPPPPAPTMPPRFVVATSPPPKAAAPPVAKPAAHAPRPSFAVRLSAGVDLGTVASVDAFGELTLIGSLGSFRAEIFASDGLAATAHASGRSDEGARLSLVTAGGRVGYAFGRGAFTLVPLAVAEADIVSANGFGGAGAVPFQQTAAWSSVGAGLSGAWEMGRGFTLVLTAEGLIPTERPQFVATTATGPLAVQQPTVVLARTLLGLQFRFF